MTKTEIVDDVTNLDAELVLAFLSAQFPIIQIGIVRFLVKHYLVKLLTPLVNEGVVFTSFKVIDWQQAEKANVFNDARARLRLAIDGGVPDEKSSIVFDSSFRNAIRLKP